MQPKHSKPNQSKKYHSGNERNKASIYLYYGGVPLFPFRPFHGSSFHAPTHPGRESGGFVVVVVWILGTANTNPTGDRRLRHFQDSGLRSCESSIMIPASRSFRPKSFGVNVFPLGLWGIEI